MTHKQKVLRLLSDRKPHSHLELYQLGCVAHSRISDLRKDGHQIDQWREGDLYLYQLKRCVLNEAAEPARDILPDRVTAPAASLSTPSNPVPSVEDDAADDPTGRDGGVLTLFGGEAA